MIKATAGGGGKGNESRLESRRPKKDHWDSAIQEAVAVFGNGGMYMENQLKNLDISKYKLLAINTVKLSPFPREIALYKEEIKTNRRNSLIPL